VTDETVDDLIAMAEELGDRLWEAGHSDIAKEDILDALASTGLVLSRSGGEAAVAYQKTTGRPHKPAPRGRG
jgi:hypothetical protein